MNILVHLLDRIHLRLHFLFYHRSAGQCYRAFINKRERKVPFLNKNKTCDTCSRRLILCLATIIDRFLCWISAFAFFMSSAKLSAGWDVEPAFCASDFNPPSSIFCHDTNNFPKKKSAFCALGRGIGFRDLKKQEKAEMRPYLLQHLYLWLPSVYFQLHLQARALLDRFYLTLKLCETLLILYFYFLKKQQQ